MNTKSLPFDHAEIEKLVEKYPTPFHVYDEESMLRNAREFLDAFSWNKGFKQYFAVKALPNPAILKILCRMGMGMDASSLAELELAHIAGVAGHETMFTSNNTPADEYKLAVDRGCIINLDDFTHIDYLKQVAGLPELVCCRYNPGESRSGNTIIGEPLEAKYGFTRDQLFHGYRKLKEMGVKRFGLHTMIASNELDPAYFGLTASMLFELALELYKLEGIAVEFINLGGGVGIPYKPEQEAISWTNLSELIRGEYDRILKGTALESVRLSMECGRVVTGPYGYLVTRVIHRKDTYKHYLGVDASMANLMRPGMYGAYHHVSVLGKENSPVSNKYDVVGSLCENNDKFAVNRPLPDVQIGDLLVIHDTGAHGHAMGFNYNGKLRSAELLRRTSGDYCMIRRGETLQDYFGTLDFDILKDI